MHGRSDNCLAHRFNKLCVAQVAPLAHLGRGGRQKVKPIGMELTMKKLVTTVALAAAIASPAFAQTERRAPAPAATEARAATAAQTVRQDRRSPNPAYNVYATDGHYL